MTDWQERVDRDFGGIDPFCCMNCKRHMFAHSVNEIKHCLEAVKTIVKEGKDAARAAIQSEKDYSKYLVNENRKLAKSLNPKYKGSHRIVTVMSPFPDR